MRIAGLILIFFFLSGVSNAQDCNKFKTGRFIIPATEHSREVKIKRTKKKQIERGEGVVTKNRVFWTDECTYILIDLKTKDELGIVKPGTITCRIIETGDDFYISETSKEGMGAKINIKVNVEN